VTVDLPDEPLPPPVETTAYLVICEALVNALRHADSEHVAIVGRVTGGRLIVQVSDDGRGGAEPSHEGSGLLGLRERAAAAGGRLTVTSPVGGGTSVTLELPCA
jgi:signal transduction histidine kinase